MRRRLSVSMMCVDFGNLCQVLREFQEEGVSYLHIDVMDGHFVPNLMLGVSYVVWLRRNVSIPLDLHLMVERPSIKLDWFPIRKNDLVTVHVESERDPLGALAAIRRSGAKAVLAISPQTSVGSVLHLLDHADGICVMMVVPGFSGQEMIPGTLEKIEALSAYRRDQRKRFFIEADGHVSLQNTRELEEAGTDIFVAGTSLLGPDPAFYRERIRAFFSV